MKNFAFAAAAFEGSLVVVAIVLGWLLGSPPLATFRWVWGDVLLGLAATAPPLVVFWLCLRCPLGPFQEIVGILNEKLIPLFHGCRFVHLALIAVFAGLGEEMLFRGVVQAAVAAEIGPPHGVWIGLAVAAVLFGLLHAITPLYAALAGLIGLYLGWVWLATGNLLTPVISHALYDLLALLYLLKRHHSLGGRTGAGEA